MLGCPAVTILHLIRHGRASALEADYDQLQPLGELQARLLGKHLAEREQLYDAVYVGPLRRQRETLCLMREAAGPWAERWPEAHVLDGLAEGPFELLMKTHLRLRIKVDPAMQALLSQMKSAADEAGRAAAVSAMYDRLIGLWRTDEIRSGDLESAAAFTARVVATADEIARREGPGRHVAVVTSNGVIGELLVARGSLALTEGVRLGHYNTSISVLELQPEGGKLHSHNVTAHLSDPSHLTLL